MGQIFVRLKRWCYTEATEQLLKQLLEWWRDWETRGCQHNNECIVKGINQSTIITVCLCTMSPWRNDHTWSYESFKVKQKWTMTNIFVCLFFSIKCMGGKHSLLTGILLTRIQAQNTINMKNLCTLFNNIHIDGITKISYYQGENC